MEESVTAIPRKDPSYPRSTEQMTSHIESASSTTWQTKRTILLHRISIRITPPLLLFLSILCLMLTGYASWSCSFVTHDAPSADAAVPSLSLEHHNSSSPFTHHDNNNNNTTTTTISTQQQQQQHHYRISSSYGLWTLQDDDNDTTTVSTAQCHLWYVFFVGAQLDGWIKLAQSCSMTAQVIGLMVTVGILQQLFLCRCDRQWYRYGVGALWVALFVASIATRQQFNSWTLFFGSTYLVLLWLVPSSTTTTTTTTSVVSEGTTTTATTAHNLWPLRLSYAALTTGCLTLLATISMRQSAVCTCSTMVLPLIQGQALEFGACDDDDTESLRSLCRLGRAGWVMVASGIGWTFLGVLLRLWCSSNGQRPEPEHGLDEDRPRCQRRKPAISAYAYNADDDDEAQRATTGCINDDDVEDNNPKLTGRQRCRLYSYRLCLGLFLLSYLAIILLLVFSHRQNNQAAKLPDTSANFLTDTVCAFQPTHHPLFSNNNDDDNDDNAHDSSEFVTFPSKEQALAAGYQVAHCGACGYCSNPSDITTYINTRTTIADTAKTCGKYTVMGRSRWYDSESSSSSSSSSLYDCLEDRIGFTPECTQCWVDNMKTTARRCMMTCVSTVLNGFMGQNNMETLLGSTTTTDATTSASASESSSSHWMNQCFFCDEKQSGPAFVQCSGVARRRLGIASEISRDPREQCTAVDWDWTKVKLDTLFWNNGKSGSSIGHDTSV